MKSILISIKPKYVVDILNGKKTIEIRKTMPKCELPIDVYIYCTKDKELLCRIDNEWNTIKFVRGPKLKSIYNGKVVAKFTLNKVEEILYFDEMQIPDGYEDYDGNWVDTSKHCKDVHWFSNGKLEQSCLTYDELHKYLGSKNGYAWHISNLVIFDKPKELEKFKHIVMEWGYGKYGFNKWKEYYAHSLTKAPQSWCYVEAFK